MDYFNSAALLPLILGLTYIIAGWAMIKFPPKWPNYLYGYRTGRAMKNEENWVFAQRFSSKEMMKAGVVFLLLGAVSPIIPTEDIYSIGIFFLVLFVLFIYPIITTERALKKFEKENKISK